MVAPSFKDFPIVKEQYVKVQAYYWVQSCNHTQTNCLPEPVYLYQQNYFFVEEQHE